MNELVKAILYERLSDNLDVACENAADLDEESFAMLRRNGIGASDMSAVLGTMDNFRTRDDILTNKLAREWTLEEQEIGKKVNVRKGKDLEPLILRKASLELDRELFKPPEMFRLRTYPWITVNFDGLYLDETKIPIPVEAKYTSTFADKYWNYTNFKPDAVYPRTCTFLEYCEAWAKHLGVPPYYLVQVQVQMLATNAPYGHIVSLRDKDWTVYAFRIPRDERIIDEIVVQSSRLWNQIQKLKGV